MGIHQKPGSLATEQWKNAYEESFSATLRRECVYPVEYDVAAFVQHNWVSHTVCGWSRCCYSIPWGELGVLPYAVTAQIKVKIWQRWYNEERPSSTPVLWNAYDCCYSPGARVPNAGRIQEGNTNPTVGAWISLAVPRQEKEHKDQQERVDSLLTGGTKLGGRPNGDRLG